MRKTRGADSRQRWWTSQYDSTEYTGDILTLSPQYQKLVDLQHNLVPPTVEDVVDIGCGWGTLTKRLIARKRVNVTAIDFIERPLKHLRAAASDKRLKLIQQSVDGNTLVALRRWIHGEIQDISEILRGLPAETMKQTLWLCSLSDARLHMAMRGSQMDVKALGKQLALSKSSLEALVDINSLAQLALRRISQSEAERRLTKPVLSCVANCKLLPLAEANVDCVVCSLLLNYLQRPGDTLSEAFRVLKPGGCIVVSVYLKDAEMSEIYMNLLSTIEAGSDNESVKKQQLDAARAFSNFASRMHHFEEEGTFSKFSASSLEMLVTHAGFVKPSLQTTLGTPARVVVCCAGKP